MKFKLNLNNLKVRKAGLPPLLFNGSFPADYLMTIQEQGQARLPDPELNEVEQF